MIKNCNHTNADICDACRNINTMERQRKRITELNAERDQYKKQWQSTEDYNMKLLDNIKAHKDRIAELEEKLDYPHKEIAELQKENKRLMLYKRRADDVLHRVSRMDYRGNRSSEAQIAYEFLQEQALGGE